MTLSKNRWQFFALKLIIFLLALGFIYYRVFHNKDIDIIVPELAGHGVDANNIMLLLACVTLMLLNWTLEAIKWRLLVHGIERISLSRALRAIFTGVSVSIFTPNRLGSFVGRILHLTPERRVDGTIATFYGNLGQLVATIVAGVIGAFLFFQVGQPLVNEELSWVPYLFLAGMPIAAVLVLVYFFPERYIRKIRKWGWVKKRIPPESVEYAIKREVKWKVLLLSFGRYIIFTGQFLLFLRLFDATTMAWYVQLALIMVLWLLITFVPTPFLGKLGVRESVALFLFGIGTNESQILSASLSLWCVNIAIPAIIGGVFVFQLKTRKTVAD